MRHAPRCAAASMTHRQTRAAVPELEHSCRADLRQPSAPSPSDSAITPGRLAARGVIKSFISPCLRSSYPVHQAAASNWVVARHAVRLPRLQHSTSRSGEMQSSRDSSGHTLTCGDGRGLAVRETPSDRNRALKRTAAAFWQAQPGRSFITWEQCSGRLAVTLAELEHNVMQCDDCIPVWPQVYPRNIYVRRSPDDPISIEALPHPQTGPVVHCLAFRVVVEAARSLRERRQRRRRGRGRGRGQGICCVCGRGAGGHVARRGDGAGEGGGEGAAAGAALHHNRPRRQIQARRHHADVRHVQNLQPGLGFSQPAARLQSDHQVYLIHRNLRPHLASSNQQKVDHGVTPDYRTNFKTAFRYRENSTLYF